MVQNSSYQKCIEACQECAAECLSNVVSMLGKKSDTTAQNAA